VSGARYRLRTANASATGNAAPGLRPLLGEPEGGCVNTPTEIALNQQKSRSMFGDRTAVPVWLRWMAITDPRRLLTKGTAIEAPQSNTRFFSTTGLARLTSRNPRKTVLVWLIILVFGGIAASTLSDYVTTDSRILSNPEAQQGLDLIEQQMGRAPLDETIVITSNTLTVDDAAFQAVVADTAAALRSMPQQVDVSSVATYLELPIDQTAGLISNDRHSAIIPVTTLFSELPKKAEGKAFLDTITASSTADVDVLPVGAISLDETFSRIADEDLLRGEGVSIVAALIILIVVLGALVGAGLPLLLGVVSIVVATGLAALIARTTEMSFIVTQMISMIGLAVGIDYALFIVERYREERRRGRAKFEAIEVASATASKAVLFSGMTVVLALMGLFLIPTTIYRSLGIGAVLVVIVAVAAMLTLIPALLALLGDRIDWPRKRNYDDPALIARQRERDAEAIHSGFWGSITRVVMRRPVVSLVLSVGFLVALALPALELKTGFSGPETLPTSEVRTGLDILTSKEGFDTAGRSQPLLVAIDGTQTDIQAGVVKLNAALGADAGTFASVGAPSWSENNKFAVVDVYLRTDGNSQGTRDTIAHLRDDIIPAAFSGLAADVYVTGEPAFNVDFVTLVDRWTPVVFAFVLALSFLLLTLAFRSIVVPAKAIVMNLLSVGAAYGLLVAVFQKGWGNDFLGFQQVPTIEAWLPIFLFCVLFGLSMDYHVFLLSRIREHYDLTGNNTESVAVGLQSTAKIITGAALIMVAVFGGFAAGRLVPLQQLGFGLGAAILIDATIIRSILVPSAMALLGDRNWYMPNWLKWLPDLRVEGAPVMPPIDVPVPTGLPPLGPAIGD
jgi:RND superfamily putative drug exporter